jgi:hypothetical protein
MKRTIEFLEDDILSIVKEIKAILSKYYNCVEIKDNWQRLLCFDSLSAYINEREKNPTFKN